MTQVLRIPIFIPLAVGAVVILCTIFIHALSVSVSLDFLRRARRLGHTGRSFWSDFAIIALTMLATLAAHLIEIAVWAEVFVLCGEFQYFGTAYYHSAVNYTTLGYGDVVMSQHVGDFTPDHSRQPTGCSCSEYQPQWFLR